VLSAQMGTAGKALAGIESYLQANGGKGRLHAGSPGDRRCIEPVPVIAA
jgi:hypothetical protein